MLLRAWGPAWCSLDTTVPGLPPAQSLPGPLSLLGSHNSTSFYAYSSFPGSFENSCTGGQFFEAPTDFFGVVLLLWYPLGSSLLVSPFFEARGGLSSPGKGLAAP